MITDESKYLKAIREQYESYPYPPRNAEDERQRLILTETESIGKISHYCFNGRLDVDNGFRALVAGGGTGDQAIFLAEQLRGYNAEIVYLDLSTASMKIAKRRAEIRELDNITWVHGSILDVQKYQLGTFDYINSCGVLMILADPVEGLTALKACLKENAAMGIMVYAQYGRTGVYHMQELMRLINISESDIRQMLLNSKTIYSNLPLTHCLKRGPVPLSEQHAAELADSDWYDLFLITQDRAYTVSEIYEWLNKCGLVLISFASQRRDYLPETHIRDVRLLKKLQRLPLRTQHAIAENMISTISRHRFYTGYSNHSTASISDHDNIPYFCDILPLAPDMIAELQALIGRQPVDTSIDLHFRQENINLSLPVKKLTHSLIKNIDGNTSIREIIKAVKNDCRAKAQNVTSMQITHQLKQLYELLNLHNLLLLRHKSVAKYKSYTELQH